jgi:probable F420-dependent oxidoreductase
MRLGFALPQFGAAAHGGAELAEFATTAEGLGVASLWVGDRLLAAVDPSVNYPGHDGVPTQFRAALDPFTALTVAATATRTVTLGTGVLVAPWYPPVLLARQLTSIDIVSSGRLLAGLGIGWSPEEYQAAHAAWPARGAALEEMLEALHTLWTHDPAAHHGPRWTVPLSHAALNPAQRPHPPIYLGGSSAAALRRIGQRGDGWIPAVLVPGRIRLAALTHQRDIIDRAAREAGREPTEIGTVVRVNVAPGTTLQQVAEAVRRLAETGIPHAFIDLLYLTEHPGEQLHQIHQLLALCKT